MQYIEGLNLKVTFLIRKLKRVNKDLKKKKCTVMPGDCSDLANVTCKLVLQGVVQCYCCSWVCETNRV